MEMSQLASDPITATVFAMGGLALGSFANVLIARLPEGRSITGRSRCLHCGCALHPMELIPLVSFTLLLGRCSGCRKRIAIRYPLVEAASAALALLALLIAPTLLGASFLAVALWLLLTIAVIDAKTRSIPDLLNIPFTLVSFLFSSLSLELDWRAPALGAGFFSLQWIISRGRWVGSGDILLALGTSALLATAPRVVLGLALSYILGAVIAVFLLTTKRATRKTRIAFGPFLAAGTVMVLLMGDWIQGVFLR